MSLRPLAASDAGAVAGLLRGSYDPSLRPYISHAQAGVEQYLRAHVEHPALFAGTDLTVATRARDDDVVGFCEFVTRGSTSHLGYVCIAPDARHRGLATALVEEQLHRRGPAEVTLDVFEDNLAARRLYDRLGFETVALSTWYVRDMPAPGPVPVVLDGAQAVAAHATYGFSHLTVATAAGVRTVGRTGDTAVRCRSVEDFGDDDLLAAVRACVPTATHALVIAPGEQEPPGGADRRVVARAARLRLRTAAAHRTVRP